MIEAFITFLFIGYLKPGPGTWGSVSGILLAYPIHTYGGPVLLFLIIILLGFFGTLAISYTTKDSNKVDREQIIIDEVVGQLIALIPISVVAHFYQQTTTNIGILVFISFLSFRFFDIVKLGPIKRADQRDDAFGVMLDDVYAGIVSGVIITIIMVIIYVF